MSQKNELFIEIAKMVGRAAVELSESNTTIFFPEELEEIEVY